MLKRTLFFGLLFVSTYATLSAQDADGDGILDYIDLDSDNDGILDANECIVPIADFSFEDNLPYGLGPEWVQNIGGGAAGSHDLDASNYFNAPEGIQFLYINSDGATLNNGITLNRPFAIYEPTNYQFYINVGDGVAVTNYRNDGNSTIRLGYGDNAAAFVPIPGVEINIIGATETPNGTWTTFNVNFTLAPGDAAVGEGVLIQIEHERVDGTTLAGNYDNIRLVKDTDGDGLSDCIDVDSDDPTNTSGCFDGQEAGHQVDVAGQILNVGINADGTANPIGTAYTGNTQAVLDANITTCAANYLDFDTDGVPDTIDLDDDNDGISDYYDCEIPIANSGFENFSIPENFIQDWRFIRNDEPNPNSNAGLEDITNIGDGTNYNAAAEGNTYAYINGNASITLNTVYSTFEVGGYTLEIQIGDGFSFDNQFRNDGQTTLEIGYHDGDFNNFAPITGGTRIIEGWETANGTWSTFTVTGEVLDGDAALGQAISVRISHAGNMDLLLWQGNYDALALYRDSDADGISDCNELDADNDGCFDVIEAGHVDSGGGVLGVTVDNLTGLVTGALSGYTGSRWQQRDNTANVGCNPLDTDGDGIIDGDYYRYDGAGNLQTNIDEDNDNDGLFDFQEDCTLLNGSNRQFFEFENPENNFILGGNNSPYSAVDFWENTSGTGLYFTNLVNAEDYTYEQNPPGSGIFVNDLPNYLTDGTLLPDLPDPDYRNDTYLSLNDDVIVTQTGSGLILEEGVYMLTIAVGDGIDATNRYRNDGVSIIEVGYDTNTSDFAVNYTALPFSITINPEDTPNGTWTDFSFNYEIPAGSPAIGNTLSIRIEHQANNALNQQAGNYDHIRIQRNTDGILTGDFIPDCLDLDSDEDGCPDSVEAGYEDEDFNGVLGTGLPTVNGQGTVTSTPGYTAPTAQILDRIRTPSEPVTIDVVLPTPITACESQDAILSITASRPGVNPNIEYEWAESTDAGATWTVLEAYGTGTNTYTLTAVTAAQDTNQYRVRVRGDDYFCFEESTTTLQVTPEPSLVTTVPVTAAICAGENAEFQISGGDAGAIITHSFDGGITTATTTLDAAGEAIITEVSGAADVVLSIISIEDGTSGCVLTLAPALTSTVTVNEAPLITAAPTTCAADLLSYDVAISLSAGTITAISEGTQTGNTITGIATGNDLTITVDNNGCIRNLVITAPVTCICPAINLPVNPIAAAVCEGGTNPPISATLDAIDGGDTLSWFANPTGGVALGTGTTFISAESLPGSYTYHAEASEIASGCTSPARLPVTFTIHPAITADVLPNIPALCDSYILPGLSAGNNYFTGTGGSGMALNAGDTITTSQTIFIYASSATTPACTDESSFDVTIDQTPTITLLTGFPECAPDLSSYSIALAPTVGVLTSSAGTVVGNDSVTDIPPGTAVTLTMTNNGCTDTLVVPPPDCTCPTLTVPENPSNGSNCEGDITATLSVTQPLADGDTINWYTTATGGTAIASGTSFTPTETAVGTYPYYAENADSITGCTSDRVLVTLTIGATPAIAPVADVISCEFYTLPNLAAGQGYFTGPNGSGNTLEPGQNLNTTQTVYILAVAPGNLDCRTEVSFEVTILQEPILDFPTTLSLCSDANGIQQDIFLGTDLGPGYRYDWTPNNDTNGDGVEEAIFRVNTPGLYTLQIYELTNGTECGGFTTYSTNVTAIAQAEALTVEVTAGGYELDSGNRVRLLPGNDPLLYDQFEYSITGPEGPFQIDNIFANVDGGLYTGYVRAISGCGGIIASEPFLIVNYPTFFTPNGDGINETWKPLGVDNLNITGDVDIYIYDRHGKLLARLDPLGPGWDGTYNGRLMISTDYWFKAFFRNELDGTPVLFNGHFSLKR